MIISASRRTDIPAFYSDWFYKRIQEGFVLVRNPMNLHQVSRISLQREVVDCIVFWTKNPQNMLPKLSLIQYYQYYFQFTLNPYNAALETDVPRKAVLIDTFRSLSDTIGPHRVIWRYDPIILSNTIDAGYHEKYFEVLARKLYKYTSKCIISFVDSYRKTDTVFKAHSIHEINDATKRSIAQKISGIAASYNLKIETCAEDIDLLDMGIGHAKCIDPALIASLLGVRVHSEKDRNQRKPCGCMASIDIGTYNTCTHGCLYCYANYSKESVKRNADSYDINSPLLCSKLTDSDRIVEREVESCALHQQSLI